MKQHGCSNCGGYKVFDYQRKDWRWVDPRTGLQVEPQPTQPPPEFGTPASRAYRSESGNRVKRVKFWAFRCEICGYRWEWHGSGLPPSQPAGVANPNLIRLGNELLKKEEEDLPPPPSGVLG